MSGRQLVDGADVVDRLNRMTARVRVAWLACQAGSASTDPRDLQAVAWALNDALDDLDDIKKALTAGDPAA